MVIITVFHQMSLELVCKVNSMFQTFFFFAVSEDLKVEIN